MVNQLVKVTFFAAAAVVPGAAGLWHSKSSKCSKSSKSSDKCPGCGETGRLIASLTGKITIETDSMGTRGDVTAGGLYGILDDPNVPCVSNKLEGSATLPVMCRGGRRFIAKMFCKELLKDDIFPDMEMRKCLANTEVFPQYLFNGDGEVYHDLTVVVSGIPKNLLEDLAEDDGLNSNYFETDVVHRIIDRINEKLTNAMVTALPVLEGKVPKLENLQIRAIDFTKTCNLKQKGEKVCKADPQRALTLSHLNFQSNSKKTAKIIDTAKIVGSIFLGKGKSHSHKSHSHKSHSHKSHSHKSHSHKSHSHGSKTGKKKCFGCGETGSLIASVTGKVTISNENTDVTADILYGVLNGTSCIEERLKGSATQPKMCRIGRRFVAQAVCQELVDNNIFEFISGGESKLMKYCLSNTEVFPQYLFGNNPDGTVDNVYHDLTVMVNGIPQDKLDVLETHPLTNLINTVNLAVPPALVDSIPPLANADPRFSDLKITALGLPESCNLKKKEKSTC